MSRLATVPIKNFSRATSGIFRGGVPDEQGIHFVAGLGIGTIIDLRRTSNRSVLECRLAADLGLNYFNIPVSYFRLSEMAIASFLAVALLPGYQSIYVHCSDGIDRTNALIAVYRVAAEGWPFEWAYSEMLQRGFHPWQYFLKRDVEQFAERMTPLNVQQRMTALQKLVSSSLFSV